MRHKLLIPLIIFITFSFSELIPAQTAANDEVQLRSKISDLIDRADGFSNLRVYDSALSVLETTLEISQSLKDDSLKIIIFSKLSDNYARFYHYDNAKEFIQRSIYIREKQWSPDSSELARELERLAFYNFQLFEPEEALRGINQSIDIIKNLKGGESLQVARMLHRRATYLKQSNHYSDARESELKALQILKKLIIPDSDNYENILRALATQYYALGRFKDTRECYEELIKRKLKYLPEDDPEVLKLKSSLTVVLEDLSQFTENEIIFVKLLEQARKNYGENDPRTANCIINLGKHYRSITKYPEAESLFLEALSIIDNLPGYYSQQRATIMRELGRILINQARYEEALSYLEKGKRILEATGYTGSVLYSNLINYFGNAYKGLGRYMEADSVYKQAWQIRVKRGGDRDHGIGETANNLGELCYTIGNFEKAKSYFLKALTVREPYYGKYHSYMLYSRLGLAKVDTKLHEYEAAEFNFDIAMKICDRAFDSTHLYRAWVLEGEGELAYELNDLEKAKSLFLDALKIKENMFGLKHAETIPIMEKLAIIYGLESDYDKSLGYFKELLEIRQFFVFEVFSYTSMNQRLKFINSNPLILDEMLSLAVHDNAKDFRNAAFEMVLKGKAAIIEASAIEKQLGFCAEDEVYDSLGKEMIRIRSDVSNLELAAYDASQPEYFSDSLQELYRMVDSLEIGLSSCIEFQDQRESMKFTLQDIARALPSDAVLLEYVHYTPIDFDSSSGGRSEDIPARYLAFTLDHSGHISLTDLGSASEIDALIESTRKKLYCKEAILNPVTVSVAESDLKKITGRLSNMIFTPLEKYINGNTNIFISTDGQLNLLPFDILPLPESEYAIEKFRISYLSSGKALMRIKVNPQKSDEALILADPDYDFCDTNMALAKEMLYIRRTTAVHTKGKSNCLHRQFSSIANGHHEADEIAHFINAQSSMRIDSCYGQWASEEKLKDIIDPPRILQIITHGFFCEKNTDNNNMTDNPLLRCGLALSGANNFINDSIHNCGNGEDGILTAYEISGLNLVGTELVILSACETGIGEVINGEGVFGLRRAFQHAGAESIIMSLWKVPDEETYELMTGFYSYWMDGLSRKDALRQAALDVMRNCYALHGHTHPYFWGAFIMAGR